MSYTVLKSVNTLYHQVIGRVIEVASVDAGALELPLQHHFLSRGKGARTRLVQNIQASDVDYDHLISICAACECIHEASLIHDDLQDRDPLRRGNQTVWRKFGDDAAILLGDHLIVCASKIVLASSLSEAHKLKVQSFINEAVSRASNGQLSQLNIELSNPSAAEFYAQAAANKTGSFFALPLKAAALLRSTSDSFAINGARLNRALSDISFAGRQLGVGYQIYNDCKPLLGQDGLFASRDWRQNLVTAPVLILDKLVDEPVSHHLSRTLRDRVIEQCARWQNEVYSAADNRLRGVDRVVQGSVSDFIDRFRLSSISESANLNHLSAL